LHYQHCRNVSKSSIKCLPDIREDLESRLERLLECSSQRLSKLEEMTPRDIRELRKALGLILRYLEIKRSNPRLH
jgi:hypothetical protein